MNARAKASDSWVPQTAKEWYDWLVEEERKTVAAYCDKPSLLIADHRREQDIARDYEGREILELLQNANDQAAERGELGHPELARVVAEEREAGDEVVLPLLPFPLYAPDGDLAPRLHERARHMYERCKALLADGCDTAIGMPFDTPRGHAAAAEQIAEIGPEILLFAQHLGELCFRRDAKPDVTWRREGNDALTKVLANDAAVGQWQIHRRSGKLPEAAIQADQRTEHMS